MLISLRPQLSRPIISSVPDRSCHCHLTRSTIGWECLRSAASRNLGHAARVRAGAGLTIFEQQRTQRMHESTAITES